MIKFFRRIRQRLLSENKTSRYLFYALGEIILVMVGILLALQVNNWNDQRKQRDLEIKTLNELHSAFSSDLYDIDWNLQLHESGLKACERLLEAFDRELPYHDSLDQYFGTYSNVSVFINSTGAYETLKSRGMDIISNDTLRKQVVNLHDMIYHYIKLNEKEFDMPDLQENKQFMLEHMTDWKLFRSAKPRDYTMISKDHYFRNRLEYTIQGRKMFIDTYKRAKRRCEQLLKNLETEVERLSVG